MKRICWLILVFATVGCGQAASTGVLAWVTHRYPEQVIKAEMARLDKRK